MDGFNFLTTTSVVFLATTQKTVLILEIKTHTFILLVQFFF